MNINSVQGMNAYTANALTADTAPIQTDNKGQTGVEQAAQPLQKAFEVDITLEAMALQAENSASFIKEDPAEKNMIQEDPAAQNLQQPQNLRGVRIDLIA